MVDRTALDVSKFRFGIEHEFPSVNAAGQFVDFVTASYEELARVIDELPVFDADSDSLRTGDLGIKAKRWYIEGFERFDEEGRYLRTDPKGFEIRTPICTSIDEAVATLSSDIDRWEQVASRYGYTALSTALNPFRDEFVPNPPLNEWEVADRSTPEEQTAYIHMLTYGPDISFSHPDLSPEDTIDIGQKLTYYSPFMVPFSFTAPFYKGQPWGGYSRRTYYRTGKRPAALVFVDREEHIIPSFPTLTDRARIPAEVGRIEYKAFDCPPATGMYRSLAALLLGVALDDTLDGRLVVPSAELHQLAATQAFDSPEILDGAATVVAAAKAALPADLARLLAPLEGMLRTKQTFAHSMVRAYQSQVTAGQSSESAILHAIR